jgi:hypothetical protein
MKRKAKHDSSPDKARRSSLKEDAPRAIDLSFERAANGFS